MNNFKNVIKKSRAETEVLSFQPRRLELELTDSAKVYLNEENRKKSGFVLSELIAKQTGVAGVESQAHKDLVEEEVLKRLKEIQESAYQEAFALGKEEGSKAANEAVKAELDQRISEFSQLIEDIRTLRTQVLKVQEKELIELVYQIGKKIALKELSEDSTVVKVLLEEILEECERDQEVKIFLSPTDHQFISSQIDAKTIELPDLSKVKFITEEQMINGGCRVQTEYGSVDSQVEQRVENAWNALKARMPRTEESSS